MSFRSIYKRMVPPTATQTTHPKSAQYAKYKAELITSQFLVYGRQLRMVPASRNALLSGFEYQYIPASRNAWLSGFEYQYIPASRNAWLASVRSKSELTGSGPSNPW